MWNDRNIRWVDLYGWGRRESPTKVTSITCQPSQGFYLVSSSVRLQQRWVSERADRKIITTKDDIYCICFWDTSALRVKEEAVWACKGGIKQGLNRRTIIFSRQSDSSSESETTINTAALSPPLSSRYTNNCFVAAFRSEDQQQCFEWICLRFQRRRVATTWSWYTWTPRQSR